MSWSSRRQFKYLTIIIGIFLLVVLWIVYPFIFKKSTCYDGKQNGDETGIDCGGSCSQVCNTEVANPVVVWSRAFSVTDNIYNLVAYVENPNVGVGVRNAQYEFRVYNSDNKLIGRREGSTFIPVNKQFVVFESRFDAIQNDVKSVFFEFTSPFTWEKRESSESIVPVKVSNINFENNLNLPILTAKIKNLSIYNIPSFETFAILYDIDGNAINVSKTKKDGLASEADTTASFTWPHAFLELPVSYDVLVEINPFSLSF